MNNKNFTALIAIAILSINIAIAQPDLIFKNGMEQFFGLNDTGITWSGNSSTGVNTGCTSNISAPQDCDSGRDATLNNDADGLAGFSFTKLDTDGNPLLANASGHTCVKDNVTGLVWEVKTNIAGIHNKDNTYQWGGLTAIGRDHPNSLGTYYDGWNELVQGSNDNNFCGYNNWRVPTVEELSDLANYGTFGPSLETNYFPNTEPTVYWTSSPRSRVTSNAWNVYFDYSYDYYGLRSGSSRVRLVR